MKMFLFTSYSWLGFDHLQALHENVHKEEYRSFATIAHKFSRGKPELSVPFYLYTNLPGYGECKSTSDGMGCGECDKVIPMMKYMEAYTNTDNPQVFVVPMDFLASLQSNSTAYFERLDEIILAVTRDRRFSRFGGTDHLFICLSGGCANVMEDLIERYIIPAWTPTLQFSSLRCIASPVDCKLRQSIG